MKPETKEAIKKLVKHLYPLENPRKNMHHDNTGQNRCRNAFRLAVDTLLQHPEILAFEGYHKAEWVSVEDRFPADEEKVFGAYVFCNREIVTSILMYANNMWYLYPEQTLVGENRKVTHWMPLPTPPKQD